ncbi:hypothetical protein D3C80_1634230 [compost metagenome]
MYLKGWIQNLNKLDFVSFVDRISDFANETNFPYGNIDTEGDLNKRWEGQEKVIIRKNVERVYWEYLNSCVFLNKSVTFENTRKITEKYWNTSSILSEKEIDSLRIDLNAICKDVKITNKQ